MVSLIPTTFLTSFTDKVGIIDHTTWGRLGVSGRDRLRFLHNQTTQAFQLRQSGEGCETTFVTATARTLDLAAAYVQDDRVLLLLSPQRCQFLLNWLDRYLFPADEVVLTDLTPSTGCWRLVGKRSAEVLQTLGVTTLPQTLHQHQTVQLGDVEVLVALGCGLEGQADTCYGYTLIFSQADESQLRVWLEAIVSGAESGLTIRWQGEQTWERLRIEVGRPAPDAELTEDYNPLEAGLWQTLCFDKGCYIGQETIARLNTYKGVKQRLWGVTFSQPVAPGPLVNEAGEKVGYLTSIIPTERGVQGLAYLRTKAGGPGLTVWAGEESGTIAALSFVQHPVATPDPSSGG